MTRLWVIAYGSSREEFDLTDQAENAVKFWSGRAVEVSEDDSADYQRVVDEYQEWQEKLEQMWRTADPADA